MSGEVTQMGIDIKVDTMDPIKAAEVTAAAANAAEVKAGELGLKADITNIQTKAASKEQAEKAAAGFPPFMQ